MRYAKLLLVLIAAAILTSAGIPAAAASAASAASAGDSLTVYAGGMALVRTRIEVILDAGESTVRVDGLPSSFDPSSLMVLDPEVELLGIHGLRSYQDGSRRGVSVALDLQANAAVRDLRVAYLTGGLDWSASYTLLVDPDDLAARMGGFAQIGNDSGTDLEQAELQLLAGQISRGGGPGAMYDAMEIRASVQRAAMAEAPSMSEQGFAGYHLYTFAQPMSLAAGERRRVRLFPEAGASVSRELRVISDANTYDRQVDPERRPVAVRYRVARPTGSEFGDTPLPQGQVQVMQPDAEGRAQLLGIASIPDSPAGQELVLPVGVAFDIVAERTQTEFTRVSRDVRTSAWSVQLRNASDLEVTVEVIERIPGDWKILSSSHTPTATNARAARFELTVPAGGSVELTYEVQVTD